MPVLPISNGQPPQNGVTVRWAAMDVGMPVSPFYFATRDYTRADIEAGIAFKALSIAIQGSSSISGGPIAVVVIHVGDFDEYSHASPTDSTLFVQAAVAPPAHTQLFLAPYWSANAGPNDVVIQQGYALQATVYQPLSFIGPVADAPFTGASLDLDIGSPVLHGRILGSAELLGSIQRVHELSAFIRGEALVAAEMARRVSLEGHITGRALLQGVLPRADRSVLDTAEVVSITRDPLIEHSHWQEGASIARFERAPGRPRVVTLSWRTAHVGLLRQIRRHHAEHLGTRPFQVNPPGYPGSLTCVYESGPQIQTGRQYGSATVVLREVFSVIH